MRFLIIIITVLPLMSCNLDVKNIPNIEQKTTVFYAQRRDTTLFSSEPEKNAEWLINGQRLTWGSKPINITPNENLLDTIFFRGEGVKWDTIICKIQIADSIFFRFNDCCGGFNAVFKPFKKPLIKPPYLNVVFNLEIPSNKLFLGTIEQSGILAKYKSQDTLRSTCQSAMSSNVVNVYLSSISKCKNKANCKNSVMCFHTSTQNQTDNPFEFNKKEELMQFLYLPLNNEVLKVNYNPKTGKKAITIED
jgi:hypothetical protein